MSTDTNMLSHLDTNSHSKVIYICSFIRPLCTHTHGCQFKECAIIYIHPVTKISIGPKIMLCRFHCPIFSVNVSPFTSLAFISKYIFLRFDFRWKGIFQFKCIKCFSLHSHRILFCKLNNPYNVLCDLSWTLQTTKIIHVI